MKQKITEEEGIHNSWYTEAKEVTPETLPTFINHLIDDYEHDYGTICHASSAAAIAAASAIDHSPQGGITGFQAGCIMWGFISRYGIYPENTPLRLLDYSNILYPQYADSFNSISTDTWEWAQNEAKRLLSEENLAHPAVLKHWNSIAQGILPFGLTLTKETTKS